MAVQPDVDIIPCAMVARNHPWNSPQHRPWNIDQRRPSNHFRIARRFSCLIAVMAAASTVASLSGCQKPRSEVRLFHPDSSGAEQSLALHSDWACFSRSADGETRVLLEWGLPGARYGKRHYALYLRFPTGRGIHTIDASAVNDELAGGFFLQHTGKRRGMTPVVLGRISTKGGKQLRGDLELKCDDGTELHGTFRAAQSDYALAFFERDHAADVESALAVLTATPTNDDRAHARRD